MDESLRVRKEKMLARERDRRLLAEGKLRPEQVCLAMALGIGEQKPPLILPELGPLDLWFENDDAS